MLPLSVACDDPVAQLKANALGDVHSLDLQLVQQILVIKVLFCFIDGNPYVDLLDQGLSYPLGLLSLDVLADDGLALTTELWPVTALL